MHDLVGGVDPGVGPAGAGQGDRAADHPGDGLAEHTGDGPLSVLGGEAVEARAVVGDPEAPADPVVVHSPRPGGRAHTSSMRAIGALSPARLPSLRILV